MDKAKIYNASMDVREIFKRISKEEGVVVLASTLAGFCQADAEMIKLTSELITKYALDVAAGMPKSKGN